MPPATAKAPKTNAKPAPAKLNIRPLHDKVIVDRDEAETQTASGIYLPEGGKEKPKSGTVLAVGDGRLNTETGKREPLTLKVGDKVIFTSYAGSEIKIDDREYLIMTEGEVLAVIEG